MIRSVLFFCASMCLAMALACSGDASGGNATSAGSAGAGEGGETLASGLTITHIVVGTGMSPAATDKVKVHYHGTFPDGKVFDSSIAKGRPATFPLNRVIACWTEGLQLMKAGGKAQLICPPDIAYGARGRPPQIPASSTLHFEVELLEVL